MKRRQLAYLTVAGLLACADGSAPTSAAARAYGEEPARPSLDLDPGPASGVVVGDEVIIYTSADIPPIGATMVVVSSASDPLPCGVDMYDVRFIWPALTGHSRSPYVTWGDRRLPPGTELTIAGESNSPHCPNTNRIRTIVTKVPGPR